MIEPELEIADNLLGESYTVGQSLTLNLADIEISDLVTTDRETLLKTLKVQIKNNDLSEGYKTVDPDVTGGYDYTLPLETAGTYSLKISIEDVAGNVASKELSFEVKDKDTSSTSVQEVMGGVLIGLSVALLAGVVIYFVVSKVKLDRKEKAYKKETKSKRK